MTTSCPLTSICVCMHARVRAHTLNLVKINKTSMLPLWISPFPGFLSTLHSSTSKETVNWSLQLGAMFVSPAFTVMPALRAPPCWSLEKHPQSLKVACSWWRLESLTVNMLPSQQDAFLQSCFELGLSSCSSIPGSCEQCAIIFLGLDFSGIQRQALCIYVIEIGSFGKTLVWKSASENRFICSALWTICKSLKHLSVFQPGAGIATE